MSDCCCDKDHHEVKLVEYTIVTIKRCDERIIKRGQVIYSDDMSDEAFATWVIARYLQGDDWDDCGYEEGEGRKSLRDEETGERKKSYRNDEIAERRRRDIPADEKRYLRVYHRVLESWPRPDDCCDDRQLDVLRGIERAIRHLTWPHREESLQAT